MSAQEFTPFPKIPRLSRGCTVTEKLDGTSGCVFIKALEGFPSTDPKCIWQSDGLAMFAGSRTRWVTPDDDNHGFAAWVRANAEELVQLGEGQHFGELWGAGVQRRYGLSEKRFSLFNTARWTDPAVRPACCHVVPVLYEGDFDTARIEAVLEGLRTNGSVAAPGFMKPEGVVVWHHAARTMFKKTVEKDSEPKGKSAGVGA